PLSVLPALKSYTASLKAAICCRKIFVNAARATAPVCSMSRIASLNRVVLAGVPRKNQPAIVSDGKFNPPPHLSSRKNPSFVDPHDFSPSYLLQRGVIHQLLKSV